MAERVRSIRSELEKEGLFGTIEEHHLNFLELVATSGLADSIKDSEGNIAADETGRAMTPDEIQQMEADALVAVNADLDDYQQGLEYQRSLK